jgi:Ca2+-binding EF-hand superfamily protein
LLQSGGRASSNSNSGVSAVESRLLRVITRAAAKGVSIAETFSAFDKDGNGSLTTTEFKQVLHNITHTCTLFIVHCSSAVTSTDVHNEQELQRAVEPANSSAPVMQALQ